MMNEQPRFRFRRDLPPSPIRDPRGKKGTLLSCPGQGWARREPEEGHQGRLRSSPSSDLCPAGMTGKMASPALPTVCKTGPRDESPRGKSPIIGPTGQLPTPPGGLRPARTIQMPNWVNIEDSNGTGAPGWKPGGQRVTPGSESLSGAGTGLSPLLRVV